MAVECGPENQHGIEDGTCDDSSPSTKEHCPIDATARREKAEVLNQDGHLYEETQRTVYYLSYVGPLFRSALSVLLVYGRE